MLTFVLSQAKRLGTLIFLWLVFVLAEAAAAVFSIWWMVTGENEQARNTFRAMDKVAASVLGWSGHATVSAECGAQTPRCKFCLIVCNLMDALDRPGHCTRAARDEGLVK